MLLCVSDRSPSTNAQGLYPNEKATMRSLWIVALLFAFRVDPAHAQELSPATAVATVVAPDESGHTSAESGTILREIVAALPGARSLEVVANAGSHLYFLGFMQAERDGVPVPGDGLWGAAQVQLEGCGR